MKHVTIYTTPTCGYCRATKAFFQEHNIAYDEHDVSIDGEKANEMIQKSGQMGVPVIDIGGKIVVGFNQPRLSELLGIHQ